MVSFASTPTSGHEELPAVRNHLHPAGAPASFDEDYDGCYNARRNNLPRFWRGQFGHSHGLALWERFYEHVRPGDKTLCLSSPRLASR
jgi:hypothetical protein